MMFEIKKATKILKLPCRRCGNPIIKGEEYYLTYAKNKSIPVHKGC
jgi:hypothetical protein